MEQREGRWAGGIRAGEQTSGKRREREKWTPLGAVRKMRRVFTNARKEVLLSSQKHSKLTALPDCPGRQGWARV